MSCGCCNSKPVCTPPITGQFSGRIKKIAKEYKHAGCKTVLFVDGGCTTVPGAYIPSNYNVPDNGPGGEPCNWGCSNNTESEGMDCMNKLVMSGTRSV